MDRKLYISDIRKEFDEYQILKRQLNKKRAKLSGNNMDNLKMILN